VGFSGLGHTIKDVVCPFSPTRAFFDNFEIERQLIFVPSAKRIGIETVPPENGAKRAAIA
jgi:hypothetical protein